MVTRHAGAQQADHEEDRGRGAGVELDFAGVHAAIVRVRARECNASDLEAVCAGFEELSRHWVAQGDRITELLAQLSDARGKGLMLRAVFEDLASISDLAATMGAT